MSRLIPAALTGLALLVAPVRTEALTTDGVEFWENWTPESGGYIPELTVEKGDTLFGLVDNLTGNGVNYKIFARYNGIQDPNRIEVGRKIKLPAKFIGRTEEGKKALFGWNLNTVAYDKQLY
ncbi:MAG: LysM peptidoglycan-binding domain-containing protein [Candidatus Woesearchaeota archaeon]|nr:LysM peptidoglycan-binding domain-containing protein [Candidatus Woesearchaeota archaeon]